MAFSKGKTIGLGVVVLAALVAGFVWGPGIMNKPKNKYSVVYLQSGEIYVGKLTRFPRLTMRDGYILQNTRDANNKSNLQLLPLAESAWAPTELYLDFSKILFYGPLADNSGAAKALAKAGKLTGKKAVEPTVQEEPVQQVEQPKKAPKAAEEPAAKVELEVAPKE